MRIGAVVATLLVSLLLAPAISGLQVTETFEGPLTGWDLGSTGSVADGVLRVEPGAPVTREGAFAQTEFTLRLRLDPDTVAAVMYRIGPQGDYAVWILPGRVELVREAAEPVMLAGEPAPVEPGAWIDVAVWVEGGDHVVSVAGVTLEASDPNPHPEGAVGFRAEGTGVVEIDDLTIAGPAPAPASSGEFTWTRTGGPLGGLGYDVRMHPQNPDRMYVTDAFAGVFISEDAGATWTPSNQGISTRTGASGDAIPVFCLTIDPHDSDIVWVGTQFTRGIFRSEDGGRTWVEKDAGVVEADGITFRGITVDPRSSDTVYAAAELSSWAWAGEERLGREFDRTAGVVYRTTDGGDRWEPIWRGDNLARYVWIAPDDPDTIFISTGIFDREAADSEPAARSPGGEGVVKSVDGGETWTNAIDGLDNLYVGSLFMHPVDPDVMLAGTGNNQYYDHAGVYLTTDGGATWSRTLSDDIITSVEYSVIDPDIAYAGSAGAIYRSIDGGRSWERVTNPPNWGAPGVVSGFPIDFQIDPRNPDRLFANNYGGGNFVSEDGGRTWRVASAGYTGAQVRALGVDPDHPGRVVAAARSGIFASDDGGGSWQGLAFPPAPGLEWNAVALDPAQPDHVLASSNWDPVIVESRDGGRTWTVGDRRLPEGQGWRTIVFAPSDPNTVYAGSAGYYSAGTFAAEIGASGIWISHDGGSHWEEANDSSTADAHVAGIAVHPTDPGTAYAASPTHGLLVTTDGGAGWSVVEGLPAMARSVAIDPADPGVVLAGFFGNGVFRSTDAGTTWTRAAAGMPAESVVSAVVFDPSSVAYAADEMSGVYRSVDGGASWTRINDGLATRAVGALAVSSDGSHVYAGTDGGGVYRLDVEGEAPTAATRPAEPATQDTSSQTQGTAEETGRSSATATTEPGDAIEGNDGSRWVGPSVFIALVALGAIGWTVVRRSR